MIKDLAGQIARAEIKPLSEDTDWNEHLPVNKLQLMGDSGLLALSVPEEMGGAGLDRWSEICVVEEIAKVCGSTAWAAANINEIATCISRFGSDAVKEEVLPRLAEGMIAVIADNDGNHYGVRNILLTAEETDDGYVLNGVKKHVSAIGDSVRFLVSARVGERICWFLTDIDADGVEMQKGSSLLGLRGCAQGELKFRDCRVSKEYCIDIDIANTIRSMHSLDMAAVATGISEGALEEAVAYVNSRVQFGRTIAEFDNTQNEIADLIRRTEASRALVWSAAQSGANEPELGVIAAMAKLEASDTANIVTRKCLQFMGGYGYSREYPVERKMRDAKMTEILAGDTITLRRMIAAVKVAG